MSWTVFCFGCREVELDSHIPSWTVFCQLVLCTPFVTLFPTTFERASCKEHKPLCAGWLPSTLISVGPVAAVFLAFAVGAMESWTYVYRL